MMSKGLSRFSGPAELERKRLKYKGKSLKEKVKRLKGQKVEKSKRQKIKRSITTSTN